MPRSSHIGGASGGAPGAPGGTDCLPFAAAWLSGCISGPSGTCALLTLGDGGNGKADIVGDLAAASLIGCIGCIGCIGGIPLYAVPSDILGEPMTESGKGMLLACLGVCIIEGAR